MTTTQIPSKEALRILTAAGKFSYQRKALFGTDPTLRYWVDGKAVNLGRLREMAAEVLATA